MAKAHEEAAAEAEGEAAGEFSSHVAATVGAVEEVQDVDLVEGLGEEGGGWGG